MKRCKARMPNLPDCDNSLVGQRCGLPDDHDDEHNLIVPTGNEYEPDSVAPIQDATERERTMDLTIDIIAGAIHASRGKIGLLAAATAAAERIIDNAELEAKLAARASSESGEDKK